MLLIIFLSEFKDFLKHAMFCKFPYLLSYVSLSNDTINIILWSLHRKWKQNGLSPCFSRFFLFFCRMHIFYFQKFPYFYEVYKLTASKKKIIVLLDLNVNKHFWVTNFQINNKFSILLGMESWLGSYVILFLFLKSLS